MGKTTTLTRHAISPPAFESTKVHRERLVDTIHANLPRKLIAVIAPAGYGKTTLLSDFASHTELPVCWLRLTEADRDVMRMAGVLQASLASRFRRLQKVLRVDAMANADESAVAAAFARVIGSAVPEPFVLIVDDVHLVNPSPSVMRFWAKFIEVQPENVTVIMAGREVPNLPLEELLEKNRVAGIGPLELSLTTSELVELCEKAMGRCIEVTEAERLRKETGGWVMGVLLSGALPVAGLGVLVQSPRPMVNDYLAAVVLNRQTARMRKFLLYSSVLPVMTAEACDEVLGRRGSGRVLAQAVRNGLFLSSTGERPKTYEYHPQFREFLQSVLVEKYPRELRRLRVAAGEHLARNGAVELAVDLYLGAGDERKAGKLVLKHARAIRRAGRRETLERWMPCLKTFPAARAELAIDIGTALADRGEVDDAQQMFSEARQLARRAGLKGLSVRSLSGLSHAAFVAGFYTKARAFARQAERQSKRMTSIVRGDALRFLAVSDSVMHPSDPRNLAFLESAVNMARRRGDQYAVTVFWLDLAETADRLGLWQRTIDEMRSLERYSHKADLGWARPQLLLHLAFVDLVEGDLESAFDRTSVAATEALAVGNIQMYAANTWLRATVLGLVGRTNEALRILDEGEEFAKESQMPNAIAWLLITRADLLRWRGRIEEARRTARRLVALQISNEQMVGAKTLSMVIEFWGRPHELVAALTNQLRLLGRKGNPTDKAFVHWHLARAYYELGKLEKHAKSLRYVLAAGKSPTVALEFASEVSHAPWYGEWLIESHPHDEALRRIVGLSDRFRRSRGRSRPLGRKQNKAIIEVKAFQPNLSVFVGGSEVRLRPLDCDLLVFLLNGDGTSSEKLAEKIWPTISTEKQRASLHSAIYRLRGLLGQHIVETCESGYRIGKDARIQYDVTEFLTAVELARTQATGGDESGATAARKAIRVYGEGFLSAATTSLVRGLGSELERLYCVAAVIYAEKCLAAGRPQEAEPVLRRAIALDPSADYPVEVILDAIAMQGRWGDLSRVYAEYSHRLREDLGLDPSLRVRKKYESLLNASVGELNEDVSAHIGVALGAKP